MKNIIIIILTSLLSFITTAQDGTVYKSLRKNVYSEIEEKIISSTAGEYLFNIDYNEFIISIFYDRYWEHFEILDFDIESDYIGFLLQENKKNGRYVDFFISFETEVTEIYVTFEDGYTEYYKVILVK